MVPPKLDPLFLGKHVFRAISLADRPAPSAHTRTGKRAGIDSIRPQQPTSHLVGTLWSCTEWKAWSRRQAILICRMGCRQGERCKDETPAASHRSSPLPPDVLMADVSESLASPMCLCIYLLAVSPHKDKPPIAGRSSGPLMLGFPVSCVVRLDHLPPPASASTCCLHRYSTHLCCLGCCQTPLAHACSPPPMLATSTPLH